MATRAKRRRVAGRARIGSRDRFGTVVEFSPRYDVITRTHGLVAVVAGVAAGTGHERMTFGATGAVGFGVGAVISAKRASVVFGTLELRQV